VTDVSVGQKKDNPRPEYNPATAGGKQKKCEDDTTTDPTGPSPSPSPSPSPGGDGPGGDEPGVEVNAVEQAQEEFRCKKMKEAAYKAKYPYMKEACLKFDKATGAWCSGSMMCVLGMVADAVNPLQLPTRLPACLSACSLPACLARVSTQEARTGLAYSTGTSTMAASVAIATFGETSISLWE
jgi:hypothetical protein